MKREVMNVLLLSVLGGIALSAHAGGEKGKSMDTNGDGMISASEHAAGTQAKFARMDTDRDGQVTAAEMEAGHKGASEKMSMMDGDGNGMISTTEHSAAAQTMFDEADANDDGNLSQQEWKAHHESKMDRGTPPAGR